MDKTDIEGSRPIMDQILIDFQGGSHGNFLEFLLNKFYHNRHDWVTPFTNLGTSHNKPYNNNTKNKFLAWHFTNIPPYVPGPDTTVLNKNSNIVLITFDASDLLVFMSLSLLRAGELNIENDALEIDTYNKLNNINYRNLLENIIESYQIKDSCSPDNPNVSRHILREFFKFGFKTPDINGFIQLLNQSKQQLTNKNIYEFPFDSFYNINQLKYQLTNLAEYFKISLTIDEIELERLHITFLSKNPYINIKSQCDTLVRSIINKELVDIPKLSLFQESYINAQLENMFDIEMPFFQDQYFKTTRELFDYINQKLSEQL
jgi:hypothetical protein